MALSREEEFSRVRELLDFPKAQRPTPHQIVSELIRCEQFMTTQLNLSGRPWTDNSTTVTSVAGQAEYTLDLPAFGKPFVAYRALADNVVAQIPFTDWPGELADQSYDFQVIPTSSGLTMLTDQGEKLAFLRKADGTRKVRIMPIPEVAGRVYTIHYATGRQEWSDFELSDVPVLPELTDYRTTRTALALVARSEWDGLDADGNRRRRDELAKMLAAQAVEQTGLFERFIRSIQTETVGHVGYWYE